MCIFYQSVLNSLSFFSLKPRLYKSKQTQEWVNDSSENMLSIAEKQFTHAITLSGTKHYEPWVYHLMLGKILAKLQNESKQILDHFIKVHTAYCRVYNYCN